MTHVSDHLEKTKQSLPKYSKGKARKTNFKQNTEYEG